jgi:hypothetical protein
MGKKKKKLCYSVVTACRTRTGYDACENACSGESRKCAPTGCRVHAVLRIVEGFTVKPCNNRLFSRASVADSVKRFLCPSAPGPVTESESHGVC